MPITLHSCEDCAHWTWHTTAPGGYCGIYSSRCANCIAEGKTPPRFLSWDEVPEEYIVDKEVK